MIFEEYEWDENKNLANQKKHGFDFIDACKVFTDPNIFELINTKRDYGEVRYVSIGMVDGVLVTIVYTIRLVDNVFKKRIISVRRSSKNEERIYYGNDAK